MNSIFTRRTVVFGLLLLSLSLLVGCATTDADNMSSRPWGYRSGYDPGLPSMLNEGR